MGITVDKKGANSYDNKASKGPKQSANRILYDVAPNTCNRIRQSIHIGPDEIVHCREAVRW